MLTEYCTDFTYNNNCWCFLSQFTVNQIDFSLIDTDCDIYLYIQYVSFWTMKFRMMMNQQLPWHLGHLLRRSHQWPRNPLYQTNPPVNPNHPHYPLQRGRLSPSNLWSSIRNPLPLWIPFPQNLDPWPHSESQHHHARKRHFLDLSLSSREQSGSRSSFQMLAKQ